MYNFELELAKKASVQAGNLLKKRQNMEIDDFSGKDIKLSSDKLSEKVIMEILKDSNIPILSEEFGVTGELGGKYWVVDPLDGTINYFKGIDEFSCVSVALWDQGGPVVGVVYRFMSDELFYGEIGKGAYLNGEALCPSNIKKISEAVLATGFPVKRSYDEESLSSFIRKVQQFKKIRMLGAAAIMGTFVACGRVDVYYEEKIMLWDISAAVAIVNAAGGCAEIKILDDNKCICRCFASKALQEDYYAQGI